MEREIRFGVTVRAPAAAVWPLLTEPRSIPSWWDGLERVTLAGSGAGGVYTLHYASGSPDTCAVAAWEPDRHLSYAWTSSEPAPTQVTFRIEARPGGCALRFENTGYGEGERWDRAYDANFVGWLQMLLAVRRLAGGAASAR